MLILLDLDGVLADFERGFILAWQRAYPGLATVAFEDRINFHLAEDYPEAQRPLAQALMTAPGFISGLPPVPGAIEGYRALIATGLDVHICTSPLRVHTHCVGEKFEWVGRHLGTAAAERMIMTRDKTLVRGDLLIDDRPALRGTMAPGWRHILFDAPYNRIVTDKPRMDWSNWRSVLAGELYHFDR